MTQGRARTLTDDDRQVLRDVEMALRDYELCASCMALAATVNMAIKIWLAAHERGGTG